MPHVQLDVQLHRSGARALAVTSCPTLAVHLAGLHPGVRTALLTRIAGPRTLRDTDALLLLTHRGFA